MVALFAQQSNIIEFPPTATVQGKRHVIFSSLGNDWYTPSVYIEAARQVMGGIDLDPASSQEANKIVKAAHYYTEQQNGLLQPFFGRVWCNPPYGITNGKSNQGTWAKRIIAEYKQRGIEQAILLVNAKTDTRWFRQLWEYPVCFTYGRVNYYTSKTSTTVGNTNGSAFIYLGCNGEKFDEVFSKFGRVVPPLDKSNVVPIPLSLWEVQP